MSSFLISIQFPVHSKIIFPNLSIDVLPGLGVDNTGSCVGPRNEIGHTARCQKRLMRVFRGGRPRSINREQL